jgi:response regulator RpfG family c-di-GMP phosphodiesterase
MKLLIVDGAQLNRRHLESMLRDIENCETVALASAEDALAWCESGGKPDLAVVSYELSGMNGLELVARIHALNGVGRIPTLMVSATDDKALRLCAFETGVIDFLTHPVDRAEFTSRVKNILALRVSYNEQSETADWLAQQVREATEHLMERERQVICRLARVAEYRDPETGLHTARVGHFSNLISKALRLKSNVAETIFLTAPLHDVGKIALPDYLLSKTGKLTPAEFELTKQHTLFGHELLYDQSSALLSTAAQIAISHHERFDGAGYPHGLKGEAIPLSGRICAVADSFDVLTSTRPYKPASSVGEAVAEIQRCRGQQFDPKVVDAFASALDEIKKIRERYADKSPAPGPALKRSSAAS